MKKKTFIIFSTLFASFVLYKGIKNYISNPPIIIIKNYISNPPIIMDTFKSSAPVKNFPYDQNCFFKSYPNFNPPMNNKQDFKFLKTDEGRTYKKILFYNGYAGGFGFGLGHKPFASACCKEARCFLTDKKEKIPIKQYDAVIFDFRGIDNLKLSKKERTKDQRWIFYEREPPTQSSRNPEKYEGVFNWTMTYRRDSDVVAPYGRTYAKSLFLTNDFSKFERISVESSLKTKTKLVSWMVSHCHTESKREDYVTVLKQYIQVDIYGKCGDLHCDNNLSRDKSCYEMLEANYKFYLSFENSLCEDYVTEKFFNLLNYNIVPVVRASGNFTKIAPPHSYIDVRDFESPQKLADYLKYLDANDMAYLEYLSWKKDYIALNINSMYHKGSFCDLCEKLHENSENKIYYNLTDWFINDAKCH